MNTQPDLAKFDDKEYRHAYVESLVKSSIAYQIRAVRKSKKMTQKAFAALIGRPQSVVSRLESTQYGQLTVQTLLDVACRLDIALVIAFSSFPEFFEHYKDLSPQHLTVESYTAATETVETTQQAVMISRTTPVEVSRLGLYGETNVVLTDVIATGATAVVALGFAVTPVVWQIQPYNRYKVS